MDTFVKESARIIKDGGSMIIFMSIIKVETIIKLAEKHGFYYNSNNGSFDKIVYHFIIVIKCASFLFISKIYPCFC